VLAISLAFQVATGIWYLVTFYTTRNQSLDDCLNGTSDQTKIDYCNAIQIYKHYPQGYVLANVIVPIVIQLCKPTLSHHRLKYSDLCLPDTCYIVHSYSSLLEREDADKHRQFNRVPGPIYQPVNRHDENYPLTNNPAYPYADTSHAFGSKA
jgi:hypothetical protein